MINRATDAVSKMTIKMNESDIVSVYVFTVSHKLGNYPFPNCKTIVFFKWFEEKLLEVESEDQHLRKLLSVVETLVNHRKGKNVN